MRIKCIMYLVFSVALIAGGSTYAGSYTNSFGEDWYASPNHYTVGAPASRHRWYYVEVGADYAFSLHSKKSSTVTTSSEAPADILSHTNNTDQMAGHAELGVLFSVSRNWKLKLGANYTRFNDHDVRGGITEFAFSDNYTYQMTVSTQLALVNAALIYNGSSRWHPYISAGAGVALNQAHDYMETPNFGLDDPRSLTYADNDTMRFAWQAGVGVDIRLSRHLALVVDYRYLDAGRYRLGKASTNDYNGLSGNLTGQVVSLGLRVSF